MAIPAAEGKKRLLSVQTVVLAVAIVLTAFQLYTAGVSMLTAWIQRDIHITLIMVLVFLSYPFSRKAKGLAWSMLDWLLAVLAVAAGAYIIFNYQQIVLRLGSPTTADVVFGVIMVLLVLEATRRGTGPALTIIAAIFLLYNFFGPWLPGLLGHKGYSLARVVSQMYLTTEGIFGLPLGVSASYIFLFVFLTTMLEKSGMGKFLIDLAMALMGRYTGGPAKTAVLASGLMGTISGSAVANVAGTGTFTIPLMKANGYKPHFAGAVEACASSGGQLMPPVMGAAAFIIAEFLGIPYLKVCLAAAIPAVLYYLGIMMGVHFEACRLGLRGLPRERLPQVKAVLKEGGQLLIPLAVLVYFLTLQYTPTRSAFYAIIALVIVSFFKRSTWLTWPRLKEGILDAARNTITVALACAAAGLVIGSFNVTGLGMKLSAFIVEVSGGHLLLALVLTSVVSILMGMGMPTTASYIVVGTMAAPALVKMGLLPLAAHLFVFYFAIISAITPPVALAAYAAAGIAKDEPMRIGFTACRLAMGAFIVPFMYAYSPTLIAVGSIPHILWNSFTAGVGVTSLAAAMIGYIRKPASVVERLLFLVGALLLIHPGMITDTTGFILIAIALTVQFGKGRKVPVGAPGRRSVEAGA